MKRIFLKNWMAFLLLSGACCGFMACDDENENGGALPPPASETAVVLGDYDGILRLPEIVAPAAEGDKAPGDEALAATVADTEIQFGDFPVRNLVARVVGEEHADEIVAAVGPVSYAIPYMALMNEDKAAVAMTLAPEPLKITLGGDAENPASTADEAALEVEVTIEVVADGVYTVESGELAFVLAVTDVNVAGVSMEGFEAFTLDFSLMKSQE